MSRTPLRRGTSRTRRALLALTLVTGMSMLAACMDSGGGDTLEKAKKEGVIKVGFANEAPYGYQDEDGNLTGESVELARAVLKEMGIDKMEGVLTDFQSLIPGLQAGRYDIVAAGMAITPERCTQVAFAGPDYVAPQVFIVKSGNPLGLTDFKSVAEGPDMKLGILQGGLAFKQAQESGIPDDKMMPLATVQNLLAALKSGRVDAITATSLSARQLLGGDSKDGLEITEPFTVEIDGEPQISAGGFAFKKDDTEFRDEFQAKLAELQDTDEVLPIVEPFGFTSEEIDPAKDLTVDDLC